MQIAWGNWMMPKGMNWGKSKWYRDRDNRRESAGMREDETTLEGVQYLIVSQAKWESENAHELNELSDTTLENGFVLSLH